MKSSQVQNQIVFENLLVTIQSIQKTSQQVECIQFNNCLAKGEGWASIIRTLTQRKELRILIFNRNKPDYDEAFIKQLKQLDKLIKLEIHGYFKQENWFTHICSMKNLRQLTIEGKYEYPITITQSQCIKKFCNLTKLTINYFNVDMYVSGEISNLSGLTELNLSDNYVGNYGCRQLSRLKHLIILNLNYNKIGDDGAISISQLSELRELYLDGNKIGRIGAAYLARLSSLQILNLSQSVFDSNSNNIGCDGAKKLSKLTKLQKLYLSNQQLMQEIIKQEHGVNALSRLPNLQLLNIGYNDIGNQGVCALRKLNRLNSAHLLKCRVDSNGALYIERMNYLIKIVIGTQFIIVPQMTQATIQ